MTPMPAPDDRIAAWRRDLIRHGITAPDTLDELESHLRDDLDRRLAAGEDAEAAFAAATAELGGPTVLGPEFTKVGTDRRRRPGRAALGGLLAVVGLPVLVLLLGNLRSSRPLHPGFGWTTLAIIALILPALLGWTGYQIGLWRADLLRRAGRVSRLVRLLPLGLIVAATALAATAMALPPELAVLVLALVITPSVIVACGVRVGLLTPTGPRAHLRLLWPAPMALAGAVFGVWFMFAGPGYYAEFRRIEAALAALPGVEVVQTGGNRDVTYEDIWAHLRVTGKGDLKLYGLTPATFADTPHLLIGEFGDLRIRHEHWGHHGVIDRDGRSVRSRAIGFTLDLGPAGDFGPAGRFAGRLPVELRNVHDLLTHWDTVRATLEDLARRESELRFEDADGTLSSYHFKRRP